MDFDSGELARRFDSRGQLDPGIHLFDQIFRADAVLDRDHRDLLRAYGVEVRIVSSDEHILRLPWNLLCAEGDFLSLVYYYGHGGGVDRQPSGAGSASGVGYPDAADPRLD